MTSLYVLARAVLLAVGYMVVHEAGHIFTAWRYGFRWRLRAGWWGLGIELVEVPRDDPYVYRRAMAVVTAGCVWGQMYLSMLWMLDVIGVAGYALLSTLNFVYLASEAIFSFGKVESSG